MSNFYLKSHYQAVKLFDEETSHLLFNSKYPCFVFFYDGITENEELTLYKNFAENSF